MHGNQAHEVATVFLSYSICGQRWKGVSFGSLEEFQTLSVDSGERSFVDSFRHFVVMLPPEDAVATLVRFYTCKYFVCFALCGFRDRVPCHYTSPFLFSMIGSVMLSC